MELIVEHVSHAFGSLRVLDDVSFAVASGEVLAIVDPRRWIRRPASS
jgi:NitT/TauT family transport system ATP-binding protein